jgi:hypothetical protein
MVWLALAILLLAISVTGWLISKASRVGTGALLAATAGFALLWLVGLVNFFALATH